MAAELDRYVGAWLAQVAAPGAAVVVTDATNTLHLSVHGFRDAFARTPVSEDDRFQIGSVSKAFASFAAMRLQEQGRLSIDDPVRAHLPWFEVRSPYGSILLWHLMTHSAGIINGTDWTGEGEYEIRSLRETEATAPPGELYHYSNAGYKALGRISWQDRLTSERVSAMNLDLAPSHRLPALDRVALQPGARLPRSQAGGSVLRSPVGRLTATLTVWTVGYDPKMRPDDLRESTGTTPSISAMGGWIHPARRLRYVTTPSRSAPTQDSHRVAFKIMSSFNALNIPKRNGGSTVMHCTSNSRLRQPQPAEPRAGELCRSARNLRGAPLGEGADFPRTSRCVHRNRHCPVRKADSVGLNPRDSCVVPRTFNSLHADPCG